MQWHGPSDVKRPVPGWKTSEFWLNVLVLAANFVIAMKTGQVDGAFAALSGGLAAINQASRTVLKRVGPPKP